MALWLAAGTTETARVKVLSVPLGAVVDVRRSERHTPQHGWRAPLYQGCSQSGLACVREPYGEGTGGGRMGLQASASLFDAPLDYCDVVRVVHGVVCKSPHEREEVVVLLC
eukprot:420545-Pleurochrysis_carterae.AAC.1